MSALFETKPSWVRVARGMLFGRLQELLAPRSWIRILILAFLVAGVLSLGSVHRSASDFWDATVRLFLLTFVPLYCLVKAGDALRGALKDGTIEYLWTRPVGKAPLYLGFYLSAALSIGWTLGVCVISILGASAALGAWPGWGGAFDLAFACGVAVLAYSAISLGLAAFSSKFVALGFLYYGLVEQGLSRIPTSVREVAVSAHTREIAASLQNVYDADVSRSALGVIAIALAAGLAGMALFLSKDFHAGADKDA